MKNALPQIGWLCSFAPEEIIMAAGFIPQRLSGTTEAVAMVDAYIYPSLCPYAKSILALGISGEAKYLEGMVFVRSCDGMRRTCDVWRSYVDNRFVYMLEVPKNRDEAAVEYLASQLRKLAKALEQEFGAEITSASLNQAIKTANEIRRMMQNIYDLQRSIPLPLPGSEVLQLGLEGMRIDKKAFIARLEKYYKEAKSRGSQRGSSKPRILVTGNVVDRPDFFHLIEAAGADVAVADLCTALRHFNHLVDENSDDPYLALARRYLTKLQCARMSGLAERLAEARELVKAYSVDGIIYTSVNFCDQHLFDAPYLQERLKDEGIPVLFLEHDYTGGSFSQMKTRIETFVEMLNMRKEAGHAQG